MVTNLWVIDCKKVNKCLSFWKKNQFFFVKMFSSKSQFLPKECERTFKRVGARFEGNLVEVRVLFGRVFLNFWESEIAPRTREIKKRDRTNYAAIPVSICWFSGSFVWKPPRGNSVTKIFKKWTKFIFISISNIFSLRENNFHRN